MKKAKSSKSKKINISEVSEDLSIYESGTAVEELSSSSDIESDCITEGDMIDDKNIISIKRLF